MARLTPKQDKFCMAYVETGNASEAYRQSYSTGRMKPETINRKAFELIENGKITARIESLQKEHAERHNVTVDTLTIDCRDAVEFAMSVGQSGPVVSAIKLIAQMHGFLDNRNSTGSNEELVEAMNKLADRIPV